MSRITPDGFVLLTTAQKIFQFKSLKQVTSYLQRHGRGIGQRSHGRRRWVSVVDFCAALLLHDPRVRQRLDIDSILDAARQMNEYGRRVSTENAHLRDFLREHNLFDTWKRRNRQEGRRKLLS
jgi:hypothetical protein